MALVLEPVDPKHPGKAVLTALQAEPLAVHVEHAAEDLQQGGLRQAQALPERALQGGGDHRGRGLRVGVALQQHQQRLLQSGQQPGATLCQRAEILPGEGQGAPGVAGLHAAEELTPLKLKEKLWIGVEEAGVQGLHAVHHLLHQPLSGEAAQADGGGILPAALRQVFSVLLWTLSLRALGDNDAIAGVRVHRQGRLRSLLGGGGSTAAAAHPLQGPLHGLTYEVKRRGLFWCAALVT
mmetsp:Transcript_39097/g.110744  ORF Transcript_39097/g.110744 Transcript_39097/m.110744 type:complete len:238 (-) Transcript_39097:1151-1864(-)